MGDVEIEAQGSGPTVLLLHAGIADRRMWDPQFAWLSQAHLAVRWDARGHGTTPQVPGRYSYAHDTLAMRPRSGSRGSTRGSPTAPIWMASKALSCSMPSSGIISPVLR